jgi:hypothetical protein
MGMISFYCKPCLKERQEKFSGITLGERIVLLATEEVEDECPDCKAIMDRMYPKPKFNPSQ